MISCGGSYFRALALIAAFACSPARHLAAEPQTVTVCELLGSSLAYSGLQVRVTGVLRGNALFASACALDLRFDGRQWPVAIRVAAEESAPLGAELRTLRSNSETPYGPSHNLIVELAGTYWDSGAVPETPRIRSANPLAGRLEAESILSWKRVRPESLSICEVLANPSRYHNQVIAIEGEHRWLGGDQTLYNGTCGPAGGSILIPAPKEDSAEGRSTPDTPLNVLRAKLEMITKGRFEAWQPGVDGFESGRKGFGNCGCYQGRLAFASAGYFNLVVVPADKAR